MWLKRISVSSLRVYDFRCFSHFSQITRVKFFDIGCSNPHFAPVVWTLDYNKLLFLLANCIHIASLDKDVALAPGVRPNFVDVITRFLAHLKNLCFFQNNSSGSKYWHEIFGNIPHTNSKSNQSYLFLMMKIQIDSGLSIWGLLGCL